MQLRIFKDNASLSLEAANTIIETVKQKPEAVLCMATGSTPILTYALVVEIALEERIDFSRVTFIGLDEWVGVPPDNEGSCHWFFEHHLFQYLSFSASNIYRFNALSENLAQECTKMDGIIFEKGGIDLMLVGVGMNGHVGFNEPGASFNNHSHVINLDESTISVGQQYFKEKTALKQGITLGLRHLLESRKVLMLANGVKKATIIKKALEGEINNQVPASIIRQHPAGIVMLDEEAGSLIVH